MDFQSAVRNYGRAVRVDQVEMFRKQFLIAAAVIGCVLLYCEWLIYYVVLYQCSWPQMSPDAAHDRHTPLKAIFLADTHLLGLEDGHWFDRLRREWQMERAFQAAISLFHPEAVFVLGDLFDEGMKSSDEDWQYHLKRFRKMFKHSSDLQFHVVVGNHDIGFHYVAQEDSHLYQRFSEAFGVLSAKLLEIKGNIFVLVNSIALEGDGCSMCSEAIVQLNEVARKVNCHKMKNMPKGKQFYWQKKLEELRKSNGDSECELAPDAPRPVLLQHYPLFRPSESHCTGVDAPPLEVLHKANREKWEVVSREASEQLLEWFEPRLVLSGHTHHGCYVVHKNITPELTIPSFSWRNRNNPSFIMGVFNKKSFALSKCFLPEESTVIVIYILTGVLLIVVNVSIVFFLMKNQWNFRLRRRGPSKRHDMKSL